MYTSTADQPIVDEEIWRAWVQKGKLREEATARQLKMAAGIAPVLLAVGIVLYAFAGK